MSIRHRAAPNVSARFSTLAMLLIAFVIVGVFPPPAAADTLSPWDVQRAIGRGGNAILDKIDPDRKAAGKPKAPRAEPKKRRPVVPAGKNPPVPPQRPVTGVPAAEPAVEGGAVVHDAPISSEDPVADPSERIGPETVEPRESGPVVKPVPGGPLPAARPGGRDAAGPAAGSVPANRPAGTTPAPPKAAASPMPAFPKPAAPKVAVSKAGEKKAEVCRIVNARVERVAQPDTVDDACQVPRPVALKDQGKETVVTYAPHAVLDCEMAEAVAAWVREVVRPAARTIMGSGLKQLRVASSFVCRRRNNLPDGKLSEHGRGNAIDISAFIFADGREVTVKDGWHGAADERRFLADVRKQACARFTTVLSPDGDAYHQDHLHLDVGCHGKTCTYRICH